MSPTTRSTSLLMTTSSPSNKSRRDFFRLTTLSLITVITSPLPSQAAAQRAVGSYEQSCRERGDCLEKGDWDGAIGWNWGGKDRCDASDPRCGVGGKIGDDVPAAQPVPDTLGKDITDVIEVEVAIGKSGEKGVLRMGIYGKDFPEAAKQLLAFCGNGLITTSSLVLEQGYGVESAPVALARGGALNLLVPGERLDFGVESQSQSYAKQKGTSKAGQSFIPQPRPKELPKQPIVRKHDVAGLLTIPGSGVGYGGTGFESENEAYASAFQITASKVPAMDKEGRRVVGQILDDESMAVVARLASLPTKKGLKGVIPGQNYGPPLLRVVVKRVAVSSQQKET